MTLIGAFGSELSCSSHCDTLCPCPSAARAVAHKTMQTTPSVCLLFVLLLALRPPMRLFDYTVSPHSSKRPPLPYSPGGARFKGMDKLRKPLRAVTIMQAATRRPQSAAMIRQLRSRQDGATPSWWVVCSGWPMSLIASASRLPHPSGPSACSPN